MEPWGVVLNSQSRHLRHCGHCTKQCEHACDGTGLPFTCGDNSKAALSQRRHVWIAQCKIAANQRPAVTCTLYLSLTAGAVAGAKVTHHWDARAKDVCFVTVC